MDAIAVMDEWMANIRTNPPRVLRATARRAVDSRFDTQGKLIYAATMTAFWTTNPKASARRNSRCTPRPASAGAPLEGGIYRCVLKTVDAALADGTYAMWMPNQAAVTKLKKIFPGRGLRLHPR